MKKKIIIVIIAIMLCVSLMLLMLVYKKYPFLFENNENNVIVLVYHHFVTKEEKDMYFPDNGDVIAAEKFEEQLRYLKLKKYNPIKLNQLYCWINNECQIPKKSILITIDDGNLSTYKYALPLLEKYGFNGVTFVITSRITSVTEEWAPGKLIFMGSDLIEEIKSNHKNLEIASHAHNLHRKIDNLSPKDALTLKELESDLKISK